MPNRYDINIIFNTIKETLVRVFSKEKFALSNVAKLEMHTKIVENSTAIVFSNIMEAAYAKYGSPDEVEALEFGGNKIRNVPEPLSVITFLYFDLLNKVSKSIIEGDDKIDIKKILAEMSNK